MPVSDGPELYSDSVARVQHLQGAAAVHVAQLPLKQLPLKQLRQMMEADELTTERRVEIMKMRRKQQNRAHSKTLRDKKRALARLL